MFSDDILYTVLKETVERSDLLRDKTMLLEVRVNDSPRVLIFNFSIEKLLMGLGVHGLLMTYHIYIL